MTKLTEYLGEQTLAQLQYMFAQAAGRSCRIRPVDPDSEDPSADEAPILVEGETLGYAAVDSRGDGAWPVENLIALSDALGVPRQQVREAVDNLTAPAGRRMAHLMAEVVARLCRRELMLQARVEELATLYKLTGLFTAERDLQRLLDRVVQTVVDFMNVKAAGLRLLNRRTNELTIKAVANLSREYLDKGKILLRDSVLDTEAVTTGEVVYIEDEQTDPRVMYPAQTRREGIVSALLAPLTYKGRPIGVLRVYTARRRRFSSWEISLVKAIAAQAAAAIENARLYADQLQAESMRRQMRLAGEVQRRMIPPAPPATAGVDLATVYVPSLDISGDFYDFIELPDDNLGVAICDVMGKGIPAGLLMASIRASLRAHAGDLYDLPEILSRVNRSLCDDTLTEAFATLFYGVLNVPTMELTYVNAGHEPPLWIRDDGTRSTLDSSGTVLGVDPAAAYEQVVVDLRRGDVLLLTTDGLVEARSFENEQFGRHRVREAMMDAAGRAESADGIARHVLWQMRRFAGLRERDDDVTMIVARVADGGD